MESLPFDLASFACALGNLAMDACHQALDRSRIGVQLRLYC